MTRHRLSLAAWLVPLLLVAAGCSGALFAGFVSDDYEMLQSAMNAPDWSAFTLRSDWDRSWFRPWAIWSFWLQLHSFGRAAWTFHAFNLVLHCGSAILLGRLVARTLRDEGAALVAGALFAAMPVHAEAVTWVSGRFDVMATFGLLWALVAWLRFAEEGRTRDFLLVLGGVLFALGSKETSVLAPVWILACTLVARIRPTRRMQFAWLAVLGVPVAWLLVRQRIVAAAGGSFLPSDARLGAELDFGRVPRYVVQAALACFVPSTGRTREELVRFAPLMFVLATAAAVHVCARESTLGQALKRSAAFLSLFLLAVLPNAAWGSRLYPDLQNSRYVYLASAFACAALAPVFGAALASRSRVGKTQARLALFPILAFFPLFIGLGCESVATREVDARWIEAGAEARRIVAAFPVCDAAAGPVYVVSLPEDFEGAYVFRNAFQLALQVERGCGVAVRYGLAPSERESSLRWDAARGSWISAGRQQ